MWDWSNFLLIMGFMILAVVFFIISQYLDKHE